VPVFPSGLLSLMISSSCRAPVFPNGRNRYFQK
jgi:hypothetical protein